MNTRPDEHTRTDAIVIRLYVEPADQRSLETLAHVNHVIDCIHVDITIEVVDPWARPELVIADRVITTPTIIFTVAGIEVDRLQGPHSTRRIRRTLAEAAAREPVSS